MPRGSRSEYNEYMRVYMLKRYRRRRAAAIKQLGSKCTVPGCGKTSGLEIDHIDATKKSFAVGKSLASMSEKKLQKELKKCQLLCSQHHIEKTMVDKGQEPARGTHGTHAALRYCRPRCEVCSAFYSDYLKERKMKKQKTAGTNH